MTFDLMVASMGPVRLTANSKLTREEEDDIYITPIATLRRDLGSSEALDFFLALTHTERR